MKDDTKLFIKIAKEVAKQRNINNGDFSVLNNLYLKKIALSAKIGIHAVAINTIPGGYIDYDSKMIRKSEIIKEIDKLNIKINAINDLYKEIEYIIMKANIKYRLHLINIYLGNNWSVNKEADKYQLERHGFIKEIYSELDRIIDNQDISKLKKLIKLTKENTFTNLLKRD